ncbi:MAG: hypothetical protein JW772_04875 [Candidatus Diapherotrites archaeon]|nr:hypothetical protein [Candidatus Diapherotrites archaeon]
MGLLNKRDFARDLDSLGKKIESTKYSYVDTVKKKLNKAKRRAMYLLFFGIIVLALALILADFFPRYDEPLFYWMKDTLGMSTFDPLTGFVGMIIPAILVFVVLVWVHNRETRFWAYLSKKAQEKTKKGKFFMNLVEPFLMLVAAIICSAILLFVFSLSNCDFFFCNYYEKSFQFSANFLFNLIALGFYFIILGGVQFKRYVSFMAMGVKAIEQEFSLLD